MQPTVTEWLGKLASGEISARELCTHYLARMDDATGLNAVVYRDDEAALAAADAADARRRRGESAPLLGIPVTVKDCIDVAGTPSGAGSRARTDPPRADAEVVRRLKRAGAIVVGKTNMPELGLAYETDNRVYGRTLHPLDPARTPGGSSGGEAAILAADASAAGIGTDGGGSIRVPAAFCGLFGLRPTTGRVPVTGTWPPGRAGSMFDMLCVGPLGRSTADLALLLEVLSGPDLEDPFVPPVPLRPYDGAARAMTDLRVGWYIDDGVASPAPVVREAVTRAVSALAGAGARVQQATPPDVRAATGLFFRATAADNGAGIRALVGDAEEDHTWHVLGLLAKPPYGSTESAADFFAIQDEMFALRARVRRWAADFDVIVAPVCAGTAPPHDTPPANVPRAEYLRYESFNYTHTYSIAGLPATAIPVAIDAGLPVGVQVIGPAWREDLVLTASAALERAFGGYRLTEPLRG
jgi:Asp-tRNA(Asn)/Glu-tRNA(Gln) amidotransferase A subunit family amidase